jgi:hypothetical protein
MRRAVLTLNNCIRTTIAVWLCPFLSAQATNSQNVPVRLQVDSGTPLRLYITKRVGYRFGKPVQARFAEPVWAFDRIVIPAGTLVEGQVTELVPVSRMIRAMAVVRGDFTPLKRAEVMFTSLVLPDGRSVALNTQPSLGLASIYVPGHPQKNGHKKAPGVESNTKSAQLARFIKQQARTQANARSRGLLDFVRGPNKREWIEDFLWAKLPYHPQRYRTGTRFDAVLNAPLEFGDAGISAATLQKLGTQPPPDTPALVRLLSEVSSSDAHLGDPVEGVLSQPLFSADHQLVLPQGTELTGHVTRIQQARMFHRGGQLRFSFDNLKVPSLAAALTTSPERTQANLSVAEETSGNLQIDAEGTAKATESKTRFLRPVVAGLVAARSMDNDTGKPGSASGGANANYSGRELGGFSGFGLFGAAIARGPKPIGTALGFYGLAWSVYSTVISRGREVTFQKNSALAIRFGATRQH